MEQCKQNLAEYSHPHEIRFCDSLPITSLGKVDFKALENEEQEYTTEFFHISISLVFCKIVWYNDLDFCY